MLIAWASSMPARGKRSPNAKNSKALSRLSPRMRENLIREHSPESWIVWSADQQTAERC